MKEQNTDNKMSFKAMWSIFMAIVYFVLSYLVIFTSFPYNMQEEQPVEAESVKIIRVMLGITLFLYGVFRVFRVYKFRK